MFVFIMFALTSSIAPLLIHIWGQGINHNVMVLISALTAVIVFHLLNWGHNQHIYKALINNSTIRINLLKVMLVTLIMWVGGFFIPIYYTPLIFAFSYLGVPSLLGAIGLMLQTKQRLFIMQTIFIGLVMLVFYAQIIQQYSWLKGLIGIAASFTSGASLYIYLRYSIRLSRSGVSASQILAVRFILLMLLPLLLVMWQHQYTMLTASAIGKSIFLGLITLVLPLYFGQLCITKLGSEKFAIMMGIIPFTTFIPQYIVLKTLFNQSIITLLLAAAIAAPYILHLIGNIKQQQPDRDDT